MRRANTDGYRCLDALPDAAAYVDGVGAIRSANHAFRDVWAMCGAGLDAIDGASLLRVIDPDHQDLVRAILAVPRVLPQSFSRQVRLAGNAGLFAEFMPIRRRSEPCTTWLVTLRSQIPLLDPAAALARRVTVVSEGASRAEPATT